MAPLAGRRPRAERQSAPALRSVRAGASAVLNRSVHPGNRASVRRIGPATRRSSLHRRLALHRGGHRRLTVGRAAGATAAGRQRVCAREALVHRHCSSAGDRARLRVCPAIQRPPGAQLRSTPGTCATRHRCAPIATSASAPPPAAAPAGHTAGAMRRRIAASHRAPRAHERTHGSPTRRGSCRFRSD